MIIRMRSKMYKLAGVTKRGKADRIPLFDLKLSQQAKREVSNTLKNGWLTTGPKVADLEKAVADYLGMRYAVAVSSASAGLLLSLQAINVTAGQEVITTPFTFVATIEAILHCGAIPVLADIIPDTLGLDPDEVARKISKGTACILPVDIAGHPVDYEKLCPLAAEHSIPLISDASHAFGALYKGRSIPRLADAAVYSFHSTKNLTCGEGGMVVSRFKPFVERIRLLSRHCMTSGAYQRRLGRKWEYDVTDLGFKANLSDVQASIALGELVGFDKKQEKRAAIASRYAKNLASLGDYLHLPSVGAKTVHAWHLYIIRLHLSRLRISRNKFIALMSGRGIECGVHYQPVFSLSFYRKLGLEGQHFPNAAYVGQRVVSLPMSPGLKLGEVDYICDMIRNIVKHHSR
jgi:dTDP-4-amino-4,6-dideoxygalactose transaminase